MQSSARFWRWPSMGRDPLPVGWLSAGRIESAQLPVPLAAPWAAYRARDLVASYRKSSAILKHRQSANTWGGIWTVELITRRRQSLFAGSGAEPAGAGSDDCCSTPVFYLRPTESVTANIAVLLYCCNAVLLVNAVMLYCCIAVHM